MSDNDRIATSEALDGQTNETAHHELVAALAGDIASSAQAIELALVAGRSQDAMDQGSGQSEYLVEFLTSKMLGRGCWAAKTAVKDAQVWLGKLSNQATALLRRADGTEINNVKLEIKARQVADALHQLHIAEAWSEATELVYTEMTGNVYGPVARNESAALTAAAVDLQAMIAPYANQEPVKVGERDDRPAKWTDETGQDHILGTDGQYHRVA